MLSSGAGQVGYEGIDGAWTGCPLSAGRGAEQREILRRLHGSQTLKEIATDLYVSHSTVKTVTLSLYRKLGTHSRAEAIDIARPLQSCNPHAPSG